MLSELLHIRLEKILNRTLRSEDIKETTEHENLLLQYAKDLYYTHKKILSDILSGRPPKLAGYIARRKILVRFLKSLQSIVGVDMKIYGPFKPGDIALLPRDNAETLIKQKVAEMVLI